jgi:hypothetical protein
LGRPAELVEQLTTVHQNQCVDAALGDEPCGDDGLTESGRSGKNAGLMPEHVAGRGCLLRTQDALERYLHRPTVKSRVADEWSNAQGVSV